MPPRTIPPDVEQGPKQFTDYTWVQPPDTVIVVLVAVFLILILVGFIGLRILRERRRKKLLKIREIEEIQQICRTRGLGENHADFLIRMAELAGLERLSRIVRSIVAFDRCVGHWVASLPPHRKRSEDTEVQMLSRIRIRLGFLEALGGAYLPTTRELRGGEQFMIKVVGRDTGRFYRSSVLDVDEVTITISYIDDMGIPVKVFSGDELDIRFTRPNDGDYAFTSRVIEWRADLQTPGYLIEHPSVLRRTVKRGNLRVKVKIPIRFYPIEIEQMEELKKKEEMARKWKPIRTEKPQGEEPSAIPADGDETVNSTVLKEEESVSPPPPKRPSIGVPPPRGGSRRGRRRGIPEEEVVVEENLDGIELHDGTINDLSLGGAQIITDHYITTGDFIRLDPNYRGEFPVGGLIAQVLRSSENQDGERHFNLKFVRMSKAAHDKLARKVLEKNREESLKQTGRP